ncbi:hypothetical protein EV360DRAFT_69429 [Lentinula raphanica]|nr:hypothetical protein EV360DRAFT_69429 [Lentinula raphanica]
MSVHFPSSSDFGSRTRYTHARRVPNDRANNRHITCVREGLSDKVTFCSAAESTYTTVTFIPPKRRTTRHSDAADFSPSVARVDRLTEHEELVKAAAGVEKKLKKNHSRAFLKKVQSLLKRNSGSDATTSGRDIPSPALERQPRPSLHTSRSAPVATASLHRFPARKTIRPVPSVATIAHTRPHNSTDHNSNDDVPQNREPRARVVRRSRSFDETECASLAACLALDEAVREFIARETAEKKQRSAAANDNEADPANRSSWQGSTGDLVTDDEETLQNHDSSAEEPEDGVYILEDLMDLLKAETEEFVGIDLEGDEDRYF